MNYPSLTQKERDIETGLDYFEARYYSATQGRFTSPDEFTGGSHDLSYFADIPVNPTFYAELAAPQSLNKYQYCLNNPLRFIDPDGHQATVADRLKAGARAAGTTLLNTFEGAESAWSEDNGFGGTTGPQNSVGRGIGHGIALVQSTAEMVAGVSGAIGGGGEAVVTSPAAGTGVGVLVPTAGVGVAVVSAGVAVHGAVVGANTLGNIFTNGNSASSNKPQHGYEIVDKTGDVKKVGISGQPLNQNGTEPHLGQTLKLIVRNKLRPFSDWLKAQVQKLNVQSRRQALEWERKQAELRRAQGHSMDMHKRP